MRLSFELEEESVNLLWMQKVIKIARWISIGFHISFLILQPGDDFP